MHSPKIFSVNWYLEGEDGKPIWPGFAENSRVLRWICERVDRTVEATHTPIGCIPTYRDFDTTGLDLLPQQVHKLIEVSPEKWFEEIKSIRKHFEKFGSTLPRALMDQLESLEKRLHVQEDQPPTHNKSLLVFFEFSMVRFTKSN